MIEEPDVWRAAKLLIDLHRDEAPSHAAMRADELLADGDVEGQQIWLRILRAAEELQRQRDGDALH